MKFKFYKRKEYADYCKLPEAYSIKESLAIMYDSDYILSDKFKINVEEPDYIKYYELFDAYKNFCSRIYIDDNVTLHTILYPTNNIIGMEVDDITDGFVLDESYLGYLERAIRYIKLHDDSVYFEFNSDNDIVNYAREKGEDASVYYVAFKSWIESLLQFFSKYYDYFRYAEVVVKELDV